MVASAGLVGRFCCASLVMLSLSACAGEAAVSAKYSEDYCARIDLVDAENGAFVTGAEDIALDTRNGRLFVSAYDRRKAEKAVRKRAFAIPQGGVYSVPVSRLINVDVTSVSATPIVRGDDIGGGLRPHGISYNDDAGEVAFINRAYQRINGRWKMTSRVERVGANGEVFVGVPAETPCAANDLLDESKDTIISFDHEACDWRSGLEDVLNLRRSGVSSDDGYKLYDQASFANGIARMDKGEIVLAETREKALLVLRETGEGLVVQSRIDVPGGPDNLSISPDGGVIAAVHPSLVKMGLHRRLGFGRSPSRIVKVQPQTGAVETLFDDPDGALFSAATVAVEWAGVLIAGSVTDSGLLVCRPAE